ncbi:MAG: 50S ribosomal protein L17 [bacterium]|nr:50S ribosomal protein L17 [bacterium]
MRHLSKQKKFGRTMNQRNALLNGLVRSLIERERIVTTEVKAKSLRPRVEKIITKGKVKNLSTVRYLHSLLNPKNAKKVYDVLSPRYQSRPGGYTKIMKMPPRKSDGASMAIIELIK